LNQDKVHEASVWAQHELGKGGLGISPEILRTIVESLAREKSPVDFAETRPPGRI